MNVKFFHCILIGALLFFACSSSVFGWKPDSDSDRGVDENSGMIDVFVPLSLIEEEIHVLINNSKEFSLRDIAKKARIGVATSKMCLDYLRKKHILFR